MPGAGRALVGPAVLVLNAGSSSLKAVLFDGAGAVLWQAAASEIGGLAEFRVNGQVRAGQAADHAAAARLMVAAVEASGYPTALIAGVAHRVVHGGAGLTGPQVLTPQVLAAIRAAAVLAPLHNPATVSVIEAMQAALAGVPHSVHFDTAFHATNPAVATTYALPQAERDAGLRRYGFHGLSYASLVARLPGLTGQPLPRRLLALHLGNGVSLCAIRDGQSVATTMGYSPLDGMTMGTRAGPMDGNAVLDIARRHGIDGATRLLNRESGLLALGGASNMRALQAAGTAEAEFAIAHFCYWAVRQSGSMIAAMGGLDAVAFTGGIGEHDAKVRDRILWGLEWAGVTLPGLGDDHSPSALNNSNRTVAVWVVTAAEEAHIATEAMTLMAQPEART